ncbi:DUF3040 domain-containing protein [Pseudarthrobacter sp. efr-133-R2A-89]|uniref:DUF3040 domain-containing protein n=1 Tax=Pseudarthrobacter sp. efr-133-R2A-89 TaxID=3040302 RepID=UPI002557B9FF|nr:DUF3040 domain-containing protein [Pseudarthrobacter sp. efr-133-R2A-89]
MPLSEFEKRELELIGHGLEHDDPRLAVLLNHDAFALSRRTSFRRALLLLAAGVCILLLGLVAHAPVIGIAGFTVMNGAGYWAVKDLHWSPRKAAPHATRMEGTTSE